MEVDPYNDPSLYTIEPIPCMKRYKKIFRLIDLYAMPITLRYKQEKRFYTNWGAATSIVIILVMLGFFASNLINMFADTNTTETILTKLVVNKEPATTSSSTYNGTFIFGFRILDADSNAFWDQSIIKWSVVTTKKTWSSALEIYEPFMTTYYLSNCKDYYESTLKETLVIDDSEYARADLNSYQCPVSLLTNFIAGTQFQDTYVETALNIEICDSSDIT